MKITWVKLRNIPRILPVALLTLKSWSFSLPYNIHIPACFLFFFKKLLVFFLYTLFFLVSYKDSRRFAPFSFIFFFVSTNRIFTNYMLLPISSSVKKLIFPSRATLHSNSCVHYCFNFSPLECRLFPWKLHSTPFFALAPSTLYSVIWSFVAELHSRWLADSRTTYPKASDNFTCWKFNKCLCDRLCFPRISAALTATTCALCTVTLAIPQPRVAVLFSTLLNLETVVSSYL